MLILDAPIVPGQQAAGICLGTEIGGVLASLGPHVVEELGCGTVRYSTTSVRFWVKNGAIDQIGVREGYQGRLFDTVVIGSRLADVEVALGRVVEDDEDNLVVLEVPGVIFEVCSEDLERISEVFVYRPERSCSRGVPGDVGTNGP